MGEHREEEPWWLDLTIIGFEDDEDDDDSDDEDDDDLDEDDEDDDDSDDDDSDDEDDDDEGDEDDEKDSDKPKKKNIAGLKSALRKERAGRKKAERDLRRERARNKRRKSGTGEKTNNSNGNKDQQEEQEEDKGPSDREKILATKLVDKAIDNEVIRQASKMGFIDPEDAVRLVKRTDIEYFQDDDDPTDVEVDEETVEDALKTLKSKKKHLVASKGSGRTGSSFSGSRGKKGKGLNDDKIRAKFGLPRQM